MGNPLPPFTCSYSPNIPELLNKLDCTIAITTYQAGKLIFISAIDDNKLIQLPRNFKKPMGMAFKADKMAVATQDEVLILSNASHMAPGYPLKTNTYDALYLPRTLHYTGEIDIHDLEWVHDELWAVNTRFSCLSKINSNYSFEPCWQPDFINKLTPDDRCHLNGLAIDQGQPKFVSALAATNTPQGWREQKTNGGVILDIESQATVIEGLAMPHSPRIYDGKLYALLSANGQLIIIDVNQGKYEVVKQLDGFTRGMTRHGDYLFIGLSKLRKTSSAFRDLPIAKQSVFAGIVIIYLPMGNIVGHIKYETSVEEIYDIKILPGLKRPSLLSTEKPEHKMALTLPGDGYWADPGTY